MLIKEIIMIYQICFCIDGSDISNVLGYIYSVFLMFMGIQTYLYLLSMEIRYIKDNNRLFMAKDACIYLSMVCWVLDHLYCKNYEYFHAYWHLLMSDCFLEGDISKL